MAKPHQVPKWPWLLALGLVLALLLFAANYVREQREAEDLRRALQEEKHRIELELLQGQLREAQQREQILRRRLGENVDDATPAYGPGDYPMPYRPSPLYRGQPVGGATGH